MKYIMNFDSFHGKNQWDFLSNFYIGEPIEVFGDSWMTGEHAFQGMKALDPVERRHIQAAASPNIAKRLGRRCTLRPAWEAKKFDVMMAVLRAKFTLERDEGTRLMDTDVAWLIEGTNWDDRVWGVDGYFLNSPGRNWLGTLLMARRAELNAEYIHGVHHDTGKYNVQFVD